MIKLALSTLAFLLYLTRPAYSQEINIPHELCGTPEQVHALLQDKYHEDLLGGGAEKSGAFVEMWARNDGATWTLVVYPVANNGKIACLLMVGSDWAVPSGKPI